MRFKLNGSEITCLPDSKLENSGIDSNGNIISLLCHTLFINHFPSPQHPDLIALICLIIFYPFLKISQQIIFPQPVSRNFEKIMRLHNLTTQINLNPDLANFKPTGTKKALSWGGGLDTWAAYKLQPDFYHYLIHEEQKESPLPNKNNYPPVTIIQSNQRLIACQENGTGAGWTSWPGVLISSLWLAEDLGINLIALGGNLGSVFLNNGRRYHPTHWKPNRWFKTFEMFGILLYLPLAGLTDLGVLQIVGSDLDKVKYCWYSTPEGENCHQCLKCLRKEILMGRHINYVKIPFKGPSFEYMKSRDSDLEKWVKKYYQPALQLIPDQENLQSNLIIQLKKYIEFLEEENEFLVEHYGWKLD